MRNLWFYFLIVAIWGMVIFMGSRIWLKIEEEKVIANRYYDWVALIDDEFQCVDEVRIQTTFSYDSLADFMEQVSDGMFQQVKIHKEEELHISLKMYMQGKYFEQLKEYYPEMDWLLGMISGLDMEVLCMPRYEEEFSLGILSAKVGMFDLPVSLFTILEDELLEIFEGISPLEIYEYQFNEDGLYLDALVPNRIERNSVAVFLLFVLMS